MSDTPTDKQLKSLLKIQIALIHELLMNETKLNELIEAIGKDDEDTQLILLDASNDLISDLTKEYNSENNNESKQAAVVRYLIQLQKDNLKEYVKTKERTNVQRHNADIKGGGDLYGAYKARNEALDDKFPDDDSMTLENYRALINGLNSQEQQELNRAQERALKTRLYTDAAIIGEPVTQDALNKAIQDNSIKVSPNWDALKKGQNFPSLCKLDCQVGYTPTGERNAPKVNLLRVDNMGMSQDEFISLVMHNLGKQEIELPAGFDQTNENHAKFKKQDNPTYYLQFKDLNGQLWGVVPVVQKQNGRIEYFKQKIGADGKYDGNNITMYPYEFDRPLVQEYKGCTTVRHLVREQYRHFAEMANRAGVDLYSNVIREEGASNKNQNRTGAGSAISVQASKNAATADAENPSAISATTPKPRQ